MEQPEVRVIEYAPGRFAPVVSKRGRFEFTGGRVYSTAAAAREAALAEVEETRRYWHAQLTNRERAVVVDGEHFRFGAGTGMARGYGGRRFRLRDLSTGEVTETHDLWRQGVIPDFLLADFPNTHEFVDGGA